MSRFGKSLKTKTVHGVRTGNHSNPNVLRAARANGGMCGQADGGSARPSFAKPMRMKRADGGPTISEDSKKEAAKLRDEERSNRGSAIMHGGIAALAGSMSKGSKVGKLLTGANVLSAADSAYRMEKNKAEADRIEKGIATPGREDGDEVKRAFGGRVKMRDGSKWKKGDATENASGKEYARGGVAKK